MPKSDLALLEEGRQLSYVTSLAMHDHSQPPNEEHAHVQSKQDVRYIAPQMEPYSSTFTAAAAHSPSRLFLRDAAVLITMFGYLPNIFLPLKIQQNLEEDYFTKTKLRDIILQCLLCLIEVIIVLVAPVCLLALPGLLSLALMAVCWLLISLLMFPMQGPRVSYSKSIDQSPASAPEPSSERWVFVNGIMTGHYGLQENIDVLSQKFGRPVVGIHNKRYMDIIRSVVTLTNRLLVTACRSTCLSASSNDVSATTLSMSASHTDISKLACPTLPYNVWY